MEYANGLWYPEVSEVDIGLFKCIEIFPNCFSVYPQHPSIPMLYATLRVEW